MRFTYVRSINTYPQPTQSMGEVERRGSGDVVLPSWVAVAIGEMRRG